MTDDPIAAIALAHRAEVLRAAWRPDIEDRIAFLEERCRDRSVLDIGCVAHDIARMSSPMWLHARLAKVARRCLGVDVLEDGVEHMRHLGFRAVAHDLTQGLGPLAEEAPFDVIVAGELIEHVEQIDLLFRRAKEALGPVGQMIITTPNPYAPHRVRAAQLGVVWENVDHVTYAFPSGMVELCERHGLELLEAATVSPAQIKGIRNWLRAAKRRARGRQWALVGFTTRGERRTRRLDGSLIRILHRLCWPRRRFLGETFVYVIGHSRATASRQVVT